MNKVDRADLDSRLYTSLCHGGEPFPLEPLTVVTHDGHGHYTAARTDLDGTTVVYGDRFPTARSAFKAAGRELP